MHFWYRCVLFGFSFIEMLADSYGRRKNLFFFLLTSYFVSAPSAIFYRENELEKKLTRHSWTITVCCSNRVAIHRASFRGVFLYNAVSLQPSSFLFEIAPVYLTGARSRVRLYLTF